MSRGKGTAVLALGLALGVGVAARAQTPAERNPQQTVIPAIPTTFQPDLVEPAVPDTYTMGPGDLLSVFVFRMPDLTRQVRVGSQGKVQLPFLQAPVPVAGLTAAQASARIAAVLVENGLARDPRVDVTVREVMSRPITVMGEVNHPQVVQAFRPMSLLEVLSRAGGTTSQAGDTILVSSANAAGETTRTYSLTALLHATQPGDNPLLSGGEDVRVLPTKSVYAVGAFERPGAFAIPPGEAMTVLRVVAFAQGIKGPADTKGAAIIRTTADGRHVEVRVNIDAILHHRIEDKTLQAGDVLYVPVSGKMMAVDRVVGAATSAAVIAIGYGRF